MLYLKFETWYKVEVITSKTPYKVMITDNAIDQVHDYDIGLQFTDYTNQFLLTSK